MDNAGYATLSRQSGLLREMQIVANNIANMSTTGYRQEGLLFSEYIVRVNDGPSMSMAGATVRNTSMLQGAMTMTGGQLDLAIEGDGFFLVETPEGERLTRAGALTANGEGDLVTPRGFPVLDAGGAPVFIPPNAQDLSISADGTVSSGGRPLTQIGLVMPIDRDGMLREDGVLFRADSGYEPALNGRILQGFLEDSNVQAVDQITRMIEVQRAYELGQSFLDAENDRLKEAMKTFLK
ncbi:flagellar hook-basal body complex protein [Rhodalgimonas zhirmunskyi]|uniref:Flagellar basal-body rod protein FlgF n=1 Tax=Rhodalgimonas zhirmunskyi TaxID=2964767 RepID=A0AAJ1U6M5_9RHOB|nr:flagellar hook-basal body complex protein [Rhodoalgimonas zhirmunskyi]MDQ2093989.1 flagellar hook-basal body complex protein [Rhodoalgimonas zhirmunskyi]